MTQWMKQWLGASAILWTGVFVLPGVLVTPLSWEVAQPPEVQAELVDVTLRQTVGDEAVTLKVLDGETVVEMTLDEYLVGVLRAEMPASFHMEALKAQACAARTYTLYQMCNGSSHGDTADVCTDFTCCQAYQDSETAAAQWGYAAMEYESRIRSAVYQTSGQTVDYDGEPILAVFHASSAGQTRQAGDVWVEDLPYLQAVDSPETAQTVPDYITQVTFSAEELKGTLCALDPRIVLGEAAETWLTNPEVDGGGSVVGVEIGGQWVSGTTLRGALGLRSASFTWDWADTACTFTVTGYGHGVGLSQYGANAMANDGADYVEILTHYYTDVTISEDTVAAMAESLHLED